MTVPLAPSGMRQRDFAAGWNAREAEVERLREALERIADGEGSPQAAEIARVALTPRKGQE